MATTIVGSHRGTNKSTIVIEHQIHSRTASITVTDTEWDRYKKVEIESETHISVPLDQIREIVKTLGMILEETSD